MKRYILKDEMQIKLELFLKDLIIFYYYKMTNFFMQILDRKLSISLMIAILNLSFILRII